MLLSFQATSGNRRGLRPDSSPRWAAEETKDEIAKITLSDRGPIYVERFNLPEVVNTDRLSVELTVTGNDVPVWTKTIEVRAHLVHNYQHVKTNSCFKL